MEAEVRREGSIQPAIEELERAFACFASELWFKPRRILLPLPVITVQHAGRGNTLGWFWEEKWKENHSERRISEINICAEHLQNGIYEIAETLLHEMVHYSNWLRGIQDCSSNQYHNKKFKRECENVGLICKRMGWRGWADTELTPELREFIDGFGFWEEAFSIFRVDRESRTLVDADEEIAEAVQQRKQKLAKWSCACDPPVNVRVASGIEFDALCNRCRVAFQRQSDLLTNVGNA